MSEFTKILSLVVLSIGLLITTGCTGESSAEENRNESINILAFAHNAKDLHIYMNKGLNKTVKMFILNEDSNEWTKSLINEEIIDTTTVTYDNNKVIVKDNNNIIFTDTLPSPEEIKENLDISTDDYTVKYTPYRIGKNFSWDRKTHIVSIGIDKYTKGCHAITCFKTMYYASATKLGNEWDINLIYKSDPIKNSPTGESMLTLRNNLYDTIFAKNSIGNVHQLSTDANKSFCFTEYDNMKQSSEWYCLTRDDSIIIKKKINYSFDFEQIIEIILSFTHNDNYHIFYDLDHFDKDRGKYILYKMYTKENPTTPINQQKIYWE